MECYRVGRIQEVEGPFVEYRGTESEGWKEALDFFLKPQYDYVEGNIEDSKRTSGWSMQPNDISGKRDNQMLEEWDRRREEGEVYFTVTDKDGEKRRFSIEPRDGADPRRERNPFSIFKALDHGDNGSGSDAILGIRIARHYDHDVLRGSSPEPLPEQVYNCRVPEDYESGWLEGSYWVQEDQLLDAARGAGDLDELLVEQFDVPPLTRTDIAVTGIVDDPLFEYADREMIYLYDWLHMPHFELISDRMARKFAEREATDAALGLDKTLDRKPSEYLLDSREGFGDYIVHCDPEFLQLTSEPRRLAGGEVGDARATFDRGLEALGGFGENLDSHVTNRRRNVFLDEQKRLSNDLPDLTPYLVSALRPHTAYNLESFSHLVLGD